MAGRLGMWLAVGLVWCAAARAQTVPPATTDAALVEMAGQAGVIFAGTVLSVDRKDELGYVDVRFSVDRAVLGVRQGGTYAMREWAGLWRGVPPFHVGQRLLVMLREKSSNGMSSPVAAGVLPILGAGAPAAATVADTAASTEPSVDLRWVGTRAARAGALVARPGVRAELVQAPVVAFEAAAAGPALSSVMSVLDSAVRNGGR